MRAHLDWLVRHEKAVAACTLMLVVALAARLKFCNSRPDSKATR